MFFNVPGEFPTPTEESDIKDDCTPKNYQFNKTLPGRATILDMFQSELEESEVRREDLDNETFMVIMDLNGIIENLKTRLELSNREEIKLNGKIKDMTKNQKSYVRKLLIIGASLFLIYAAVFSALYLRINDDCMSNSLTNSTRIGV